MSAEPIAACGHGWPRPQMTNASGGYVKTPPWSCNRPSGHDGPHRVYDAKTFQVMAEFA